MKIEEITIRSEHGLAKITRGTGVTEWAFWTSDDQFAKPEGAESLFDNDSCFMWFDSTSRLLLGFLHVGDTEDSDEYCRDHMMLTQILDWVRLSSTAALQAEAAVQAASEQVREAVTVQSAAKALAEADATMRSICDLSIELLLDCDKDKVSDLRCRLSYAHQRLMTFSRLLGPDFVESPNEASATLVASGMTQAQ